MESGKFGSTEQAMKNMAHLVEECYDIVMAHQSRLIRSWFRQIGYHSRTRIIARPIVLLVAGKNTPYSSMRVFSSYMTIFNEMRQNVKTMIMQTAREEVEIAKTNKPGFIFGVLLPNGKSLNICNDHVYLKLKHDGQF